MRFYKLRSFLLLLCLGFLLGGCATYSKRDVEKVAVTLDRAEVELPESQLLDVRIQTFDPGKLPESEDEARGLSEEIRQAEALFIPAHLKSTMEQTGYWGPVRVVPAGTLGAEVLISGRIIQSDGEILEVEINADFSSFVLIAGMYLISAAAQLINNIGIIKKEAIVTIILYLP